MGDGEYEGWMEEDRLEGNVWDGLISFDTV